MEQPVNAPEYPRRAVPTGRIRQFRPFFSIVLIVALTIVTSKILIGRYGIEQSVLILAGGLLGLLYSILSFKNLLVPFLIWIITIGGFRFLFQLENPILPDLFLDRLLMVWVLGIFAIRFFAERRSPRGPYGLDILLLINAIYLVARVYIQDMEFIGHLIQCVIIPYVAYFVGKNVITTKREIRILLLAMLLLVIYYSLTSIAEKFDLNWAIWPKYILTGSEVFRYRSIGPMRQAAVFGTIIGMLLPTHLYFIANTRNSAIRLLLMLSLGIGFAGLYFTYTRGSWLAGIAALGVVAALNPKQYLKTLLPLLVVVPIIAVMFLGLGQDKFMKERVENDNTVGSRLGTAVTTLRVFRDHPLVGIGFFQYRHVLDDYVQPVEIPGWETIRFLQFRHNPIHDIYLGPLAENGLIGAIIQGLIYFLILKTFIERFWARKRDMGRNSDPVIVYVLPIFAGVFAGYWVGGIAFDYRYFAVIDTFFYLCAGVLYGYRPDNSILEPPLPLTPPHVSVQR